MLQTNLKKLLFLLILFKMCFSFAQNPTSKKRIIIDVGHGGFDTGAIGINGIKEKEVVLKIAREIIELNHRVLDSKFDIYLTRYRDTFVSLSERSKLAIVLKADLFVSLHCNAANYSAKGMEVYVSNFEVDIVASNIRKSFELGRSILQESSQNLRIKKRSVKHGNFQVIRETSYHCPSILIETGFLTNTDEADYFLKEQNIRAMSLSILIGIYKYLNIEL